MAATTIALKDVDNDKNTIGLNNNGTNWLFVKMIFSG